MRRFRILYIEPGVDEKAGGRLLETSIDSSMPSNNMVVTVNIVSNAFIGLECTEHTFYDLIICKRELQQISAVHMLNILRNVGATTPIIALIDAHDNFAELEAKRLGFFGILRKPFTSEALCRSIFEAIEAERLIDASNMKIMSNAVASVFQTVGEDQRNVQDHGFYNSVDKIPSKQPRITSGSSQTRPRRDSASPSMHDQASAANLLINLGNNNDSDRRERRLAEDSCSSLLSGHMHLLEGGHSPAMRSRSISMSSEHADNCDDYGDISSHDNNNRNIIGGKDEQEAHCDGDSDQHQGTASTTSGRDNARSGWDSAVQAKSLAALWTTSAAASSSSSSSASITNVSSISSGGQLQKSQSIVSGNNSRAGGDSDSSPSLSQALPLPLSAHSAFSQTLGRNRSDSGNGSIVTAASHPQRDRGSSIASSTMSATPLPLHHRSHEDDECNDDYDEYEDNECEHDVADTPKAGSTHSNDQHVSAPSPNIVTTSSLLAVLFADATVANYTSNTSSQSNKRMKPTASAQPGARTDMGRRLPQLLSVDSNTLVMDCGWDRGSDRQWGGEGGEEGRRKPPVKLMSSHRDVSSDASSSTQKPKSKRGRPSKQALAAKQAAAALVQATQGQTTDNSRVFSLSSQHPAVQRQYRTEPKILSRQRKLLQQSQSSRELAESSQSAMYSATTVASQQCVNRDDDDDDYSSDSSSKSRS